MKNDQLFNKPLLKDFRKNLRTNGTSAEATLWLNLKNKQLEGRRFRRQFSVENYILDFYCPQEKLCIELDGADHFTSAGFEKDEERTKVLLQFGIRVIRFENDEVFSNIDAVLEKIRKQFS